MRFWKNLLLLVLSFVLIKLWIKTKSYLFEERIVVKVGQKHAGGDIQKAFRQISADLEKVYPGLILPESNRQWVMYKYSGQTLALSILYASFTECIILMGTALDTDGYIGHHWLNTTFLVLSGSLKYWKEGMLQAHEYKAGNHFVHYSGTSGCLSWRADTWVLEYGRGFLPTSFPSLISDTLFTSFDLIGILKLLRAFITAIYYALKIELMSLIGGI